MIDNGFKFEPVDAADLITKVVELAKANPDFVYHNEDPGAGCQYTHSDNSPGCIVGAGLAKLGIKIPYRHNWNTSTTVYGLAARGLIDGLPEEIDWLSTVQDQQDNGETWLFAVEFAGIEHEEDSDY